MTCLWQHKNATQHDLGSKKPIFFNCLLDGAHTSRGDAVRAAHFLSKRMYPEVPAVDR